MDGEGKLEQNENEMELRVIGLTLVLMVRFGPAEGTRGTSSCLWSSGVLLVQIIKRNQYILV